MVKEKKAKGPEVWEIKITRIKRILTFSKRVVSVGSQTHKIYLAVLAGRQYSDLKSAVLVPAWEPPLKKRANQL